MSETSGKYVGTIGDDGRRTYPKLDLNGAAVAWPPTTYDLGDGRFVVIPDSFNWKHLPVRLSALGLQQTTGSNVRRKPGGKVTSLDNITGDAPDDENGEG